MRRSLVLPFVFAAIGAAGPSPQPPGVPATAVIDQVQVLRDLQVLSADAMEGRQAGTPGGARARAYVVGRFKASGVTPFGASFEQPFSFRTGRAGQVRRGANVIGRIEGTRTPGRYLVVSAHYDHLGTRNGVVFNGADDNASGTAALFAVARHFDMNRPRSSLIVAAFDAEEAGLRGSRHFVANPPVARAALALNVNADMLGRAPDNRLFVVGTSRQMFLRPYLERVAARATVTLVMGHDDPTRKDVEDWSADSDHYAFCEARIPCLYLGVEDFDQHDEPTDDYDTMTPVFFVRAIETLISVVEELDANLDAIAKAAGR